MKILVIGAGVLGCNLAANLFEAHKDVVLLARGTWYETIKNKGLSIRRRMKLRTSNYKINVIDVLGDDDSYDVVFVCLRYTQLDGIVETLAKNKSKNIVFIGNNMKASFYAAMLPDKNVMFGFALSAGHRDADRVVSIDLRKITIGDLKGHASNKQLIEEIFADTRYNVVYEPDMEDYLISHAAFIVPVSFACYYTNGDLKKIKKDDEYIGKIIKANIECYRAMEKMGHTILPKNDQQYSSPKYIKICLRFFKLMCWTQLGKICASDHAMNAGDEMDALASDLEKLLRESGLPTPNYDETRKSLDKFMQQTLVQ